MSETPANAAPSSSILTETPQLYLIAHKVRGEPAFDIAHKLQIGDEEGWIIPTSGHRAYPLATWLLEDLADCSDYPHVRPAEFDHLDNSLWGAAPDHYTTTADKGRGLIKDLAAVLGLPRSSNPVVTRRI